MERSENSGSPVPWCALLVSLPSSCTSWGRSTMESMCHRALGTRPPALGALSPGKQPHPGNYQGLSKHRKQNNNKKLSHMSSLPLLSKVISAISKFCVAIPHIPSYFIEHNELSNTHHRFQRDKSLVIRKEKKACESSNY